MHQVILSPPPPPTEKNSCLRIDYQVLKTDGRFRSPFAWDRFKLFNPRPRDRYLCVGTDKPHIAYDAYATLRFNKTALTPNSDVVFSNGAKV